MPDRATLPERIRAHKLSVALLAATMIALGLLLATQAYAATTTERHTVTSPRWSESATFTYDVPVTRNSTLYPNGTILPMGEPGYFRSVSPQIPVNFSWRMQDLTAATGNVSGDLVLRVEADAGGGRSYWEARHALDHATTSAPQTGLDLRGIIDLDAENAEVAALLQQMPPMDGHVNWSVVAILHYDVARAGGPESGDATYLMPIQVADPKYVLPGAADLQWTRPHSDVTTLSSTHTAGWSGVLDSLNAIGLLLGGVVIGGALAWAEATDPTRDARPGDEEFYRELARHQEWVTEAKAPIRDAQLPQPVVDLSSLDDLVQAAADARTRVILERRTRTYYAMTPGMTYRYAGPGSVDTATRRPNVRNGVRP